jgi:hypothetical protein
MKHILFSLILTAALGCAPALAAANRPPVPSPELRKLNISVGRWVFHGKTMRAPGGKNGSWTWHEDCRWSANGIFLECSFANDWSGRMVQSLVVDTYNTTDHSFWHYEMFAAGASGKHPFVSRMTIHANMWVEYGHETEHGKQVGERIVYRFTSPTRVNVAIQVSRDGVHWVTVDQGVGIKQ